MACGRKFSAEVFFQTKAAVIGSDSNAHLLSLFIRSQSEFVMSESNSHSSHFCLRILIHATCSDVIRQDHSAIRAKAAGWNRNSSSFEATEHSCLVAPGHKL